MRMEGPLPEEKSPLEQLGKIIPGAYYDLIARVCSGVPFLTILTWDKTEWFRDIALAKLVLLVGAGYVVGVTLTPLSWVLAPLHMALLRVMVRLNAVGMPDKLWRDRLSWNDEVSAANTEAGTTLAKMQAEETLCQNLLFGYVLLVILNRYTEYKIRLIEDAGLVPCLIVMILLGLSVLHRTIVYVGRQDRLYGIHVRQPSGEMRATTENE